MRSRRGFTLLEVMVATTIMGIAVVTLMSGLSTSVRNATRLTDYDRAVLLARAKMDSLLADPKLPAAYCARRAARPCGARGGARGGWRAQVTPFETAPGAGPGAPSLDRVQLEIWWMSGRPAALLQPRRIPARRPAPGAMRTVKHNAGITLLEVVIAVSLLSLLMAGVMTSLRLGHRRARENQYEADGESPRDRGAAGAAATTRRVHAGDRAVRR